MDANLDSPTSFSELATLQTAIATEGWLEVSTGTPGVLEFMAGPALPSRATLLESSQALIDFYLYDAVWLTGTLREALIEVLLQLNHVGIQGRRFALGLDSRDLVLLTGTVQLQADAAHISEALQYLAGQAGRIQQLIGEITFQDVQVDVRLAPAS
jgi:hypothetical protein